MDIRDKIKNICEELCGREILPKEQLITTGVLDSFMLMELICSIEEEYQIKFLPEEITDLDHFSCLDSMVEIVKNKCENCK